MTPAASVVQSVALSAISRATRVRVPARRELLLATSALLLFLIGARCLLTPTTCEASRRPFHLQPVTAREICGGLKRFKRTGKFFGARCRYYANSDASFQSCRLRLAGDVEPNPGPARRPLTVLCQNVRSVRNKLHTRVCR